MCTPTNDQVIQHIRQRLDAANHWVRCNTPADADTYWTRPVKTALCNACHAAWGACNLISTCICATDVGHRDPNEWRCDPVRRRPTDRFAIVKPGFPGRAADHTEWLYDVTCIQYEHPWPTRQNILLVAESEFGGKDEVLEDFAKLLVARAEIRVMVYNLVYVPICDLVDYIRQCPDSQPGDTYLFAAFAAGGINYHVEII